MNKLLLKRNYKYILFLVFLILVSIFFGSTRIISYNFGQYFTSIEVQENNIDNLTEIFDESLVHDIKLDISSEDYNNLILYYKQNNEKEYLKTNITIDGVLISDVGLKLKGNKIIIGDIDDINIEEIDFSFSVKFNKYVSGQSYLGNNEISIISGEVSELEGEYIAGKIFNEYGVEATQSSFAKLNIGDFLSGTYLIKESVDEYFIEDSYNDSNGLVYKAENSMSFTYLSEDPAMYSDLFTQETLVNNYDLKKLIEVLEFVSKSSSEDFEYKFTKYINIENYTKFLAISDLLYEENEKINLLNSYYIYFDLSTETIRFIPWNQQYQLNFEESSIYEILEKFYSKQEIVDLSGRDIRGILDSYSDVDSKRMKQKYSNDLEDRFLENDRFNNLYEYTKLEIESDLESTEYISNIKQELNSLLLN